MFVCWVLRCLVGQIGCWLDAFGLDLGVDFVWVLLFDTSWMLEVGVVFVTLVGLICLLGCCVLIFGLDGLDVDV